MPHLKQRLESLLYKVTFDQRFHDLKNKLTTVQKGIQELNSSENLIKVLEVIM